MAAVASAPAPQLLPPAAGAAPVEPCMLVGSIVGRSGTVVCLGTASLADAADLLISADHTAAGVADEAGALLGALTENDILQAYILGVHPQSAVSAWLCGGHARLPGSRVQALSVQTTATLLEAASHMGAARASGFGASHHLMVRNEGQEFVGILSALDLARALHASGMHSKLMHRIAEQAVSDVMTPTAALPICGCDESLGQVFERMVVARHNCALVADGASPAPVGFVTPRDALRAFSEHIPLKTTVGQWLRGLQSSWEPREIRSDAKLSEVAATMVGHSLHHLVVVSAATSEVVGVVSPSDLTRVVSLAAWLPEGRAAQATA